MEKSDTFEDWVAVRNNPFESEEYKSHIRLKWHVAWNAVEEVISVTCREHDAYDGGDPENCWAGAFSTAQLAAIHKQMALIHPHLTDYFPSYLREKCGLWSYLTQPESVDVDEDTFCSDILRYLKYAYDVCGHKLFISCFFEDDTYDDCYESTSVLRRQKYMEEVDNAYDQLLNVNFMRKNVILLRELTEVYEQEDEAIAKWQQKYADFHFSTIKPFIELRELASMKLKEAKAGLCNPRLGERRKKEYAKMFAEWNEQWVSSLEQAQELYVEYYDKTSEILAGK
jgi:hypothetical protein